MQLFDSAIQKVKPVTQQMELKGAASGSPDNVRDLKVAPNLWGNYATPSVTDLHHSGFTQPSYWRIPMKEASSATITIRNNFDTEMYVTVYAVLSEQDIDEYSATAITSSIFLDSDGETVTFSSNKAVPNAIHLPQLSCFALVVKLDASAGAPSSGECQLYISRSALPFPDMPYALGQKQKDASVPVVVASNQGALGSVSLTGNLPDTAGGDLARINPATLSSDASLNGTGPTDGWQYSSHASNPTNGYGPFSYTHLDYANFNANNYISIDMRGYREMSLTIKSTVNVNLNLAILAWVSGRSASYDGLPIYSDSLATGDIRSFSEHSLHASADASFVHLAQLSMPVAAWIISYSATSATNGGLFIRVARR